MVEESVVQLRDKKVSSQGACSHDSRESVPSCGGVHLPVLQVDGVRWGAGNCGVVQQGYSEMSMCHL